MKAVQAMLGHASAAMTLDTYAALFDDDLDAVADRLDVVVRTATDFLRKPCGCKRNRSAANKSSTGSSQ